MIEKSKSLAGTERRPCVISLVSRLGGTGKTTVAVNLAVCLARRGNKVLVIDLDEETGVASRQLVDDEHRPARSIGDILACDATNAGVNLSEAIGSTAFEGVWIAPSSPSSEWQDEDEEEKEASAIAWDASRLKDAIDNSDERFDYQKCRRTHDFNRGI